MLRSEDHGSALDGQAGDDRRTDSADHLLSEAAEAEARRPAEKPDNSGDGPADPQPAGAREDEPKRSKTAAALGFVRRHRLGTAIAAIGLIAAIVVGVLWYLNARHFESTDDAFIDARQFAIAPKVGGYVTAVAVTDNQHVQPGALIAQIDARDYEVAVDHASAQVQAAEAGVQSAAAQALAHQSQVAEAQAQVRQTEAAVTFAREESQRAQELVQRGAGTVQRSQQTGSELVQAQANLAHAQATLNSTVRQTAVLQAQEKTASANLAQAKAQLEQARLNLSYTDLKADQPGRVVRLTAAKGQLAQPGQALSMFVPDTMWVTANFKETQLADMRPGQHVEMGIDAYPGRSFAGHVDSVQPGSGTAFSLLPAQNATGNYVKVVQRVPVKLVFDDLPDNVTIGPGMSVTPKVRVR